MLVLQDSTYTAVTVRVGGGGRLSVRPGAVLELGQGTLIYSDDRDSVALDNSGTVYLNPTQYGESRVQVSGQQVAWEPATYSDPAAGSPVSSAYSTLTVQAVFRQHGNGSIVHEGDFPAAADLAKFWSE
jgi:hypothetical protein